MDSQETKRTDSHDQAAQYYERYLELQLEKTSGDGLTNCLLFLARHYFKKGDPARAVLMCQQLTRMGSHQMTSEAHALLRKIQSSKFAQPYNT